MTKIKIRILSKQIGSLLAIALLLFAYSPLIVSASPITTRSVAIGNSAASANTTYNFTFTAPTATTVKSIKFQACDAASGSCTQTGAASGFSSSSNPATLTEPPTGLGSAGTWSIDTTDATSLRIKNTSNTGSPSTASVKFTGVHNPTAANSTFYIWITTYSSDAWTGELDTGVIATSTAGQITVTAAVDETLTFSLSSATVALGTLGISKTGTGISTMTVATNAKNGYTLAYSGNTLTSGVNTITAMSTATASVMDSKQFGINLMANTTPAIGSDKTGTGTGTPATGYGTANTFKFNPAGEAIASASAPTNSNVFTSSYIANIDGVTLPGAYSTIITYTATANF